MTQSSCCAALATVVHCLLPVEETAHRVPDFGTRSVSGGLVCSRKAYPTQALVASHHEPSRCDMLHSHRLSLPVFHGLGGTATLMSHSLLRRFYRGQDSSARAALGTFRRSCGASDSRKHSYHRSFFCGQLRLRLLELLYAKAQYSTFRHTPHAIAAQRVAFSKE